MALRTSLIVLLLATGAFKADGASHDVLHTISSPGYDQEHSKSALAADDTCLTHDGTQDCALHALQTSGLGKQVSSMAADETGNAVLSAVEILKELVTLDPSAWTSNHYERVAATLPAVTRSIATLPQEQRRMVKLFLDTLRGATDSASESGAEEGQDGVSALETEGLIKRSSTQSAGDSLESSVDETTAGKYKGTCITGGPPDDKTGCCPIGGCPPDCMTKSYSKTSETKNGVYTETTKCHCSNCR